MSAPSRYDSRQRTSNPVKAREALNTWFNREDRYSNSDPAAQLFRQQLDQRVRWFRLPNRPAWEKNLATEYLNRGDYVRAAVYGMEAVISQEALKNGQDAGNFDCRDTLRKELQDSSEDFRTLGRLRNALAHGVRPFNQNVQRTISEPTQLRDALRKLFNQLLGK